MQNCSLTVVGAGIKTISHITIEVEAYIEQSEKVLYMVNTPGLKEWIKTKNKNTESLEGFYQKHALRFHCYRDITEHVLEETRKGQHVCMVLYGHPTIFAQSGVDAVIRAKKEGIDAKILPGISAEDCLLADLMINPGHYGCQSFEATDLLICHRQWDLRSHLIIWQVGIIGALGTVPDDFDNTHGAQLLQERLLKNYNADHKVILYEAAQYPEFEPKIAEFELCNLVNAKFSEKCTLYVPPTQKAKYDSLVLDSLGIDLKDLN